MIRVGWLGLALIALGMAAWSHDSEGDDVDTGDDALSEPGLSDGHVCTDSAHANAPLPCSSSKAMPVKNITPGFVGNSALFDDEFYRRFPLRKVGALALDEHVSKE